MGKLRRDEACSLPVSLSGVDLRSTNVGEDRTRYFTHCMSLLKKSSNEENDSINQEHQT
jgi:hypothetical protein